MQREQKTIHILYKKLINLYPQRFKEQFGDSMEQTFNDLYKGKQNKESYYFVIWVFTETMIAVVKEHFLLLTETNMKSLITNPKSAAVISTFLALPLGLIYLAFLSEIDFLVRPLNQLLTINGNGGDINMLGRIVLYGSLLLLPTAFILNLIPMLRKDTINGTRTLQKVNIFVGVFILLIIISTWGGLILESIYCTQGIRCD